MKTVEFTVEGLAPFPYDMLRYDSCFPANQEAARRMGLLSFADDDKTQITLQTHTTTRTASLAVCPDRWKSFGWAVNTPPKFI